MDIHSGASHRDIHFGQFVFSHDRVGQITSQFFKGLHLISHLALSLGLQ